MLKVPKKRKRDNTHVSTKIKISTLNKASKKERLEELTEAPIEEHVILRLPPTEATREFRSLVKKRKIPEAFNIHFSDPRSVSVQLGLGSHALAGKLVDLPAIIESQKTIDNKQFYKIADISQMIIVHDPKHPHTVTTTSQDKTQFPDGITPPMRAARLKKFRKRMSKKVIEDVEREVERLLQADLEADDVKFEVMDQKDLEAEQEGTEDFTTEREATEDIQAGPQEDDFLAAEIEQALYAPGPESESESSEEDEDEESEQEEEAEGQVKEHVAILKEEISDLERKIAEKKSQIVSQVNPIIKKRFEDIIARLTTELELKKEQLEMTKEEEEENE